MLIRPELVDGEHEGDEDERLAGGQRLATGARNVLSSPRYCHLPAAMMEAADNHRKRPEEAAEAGDMGLAKRHSECLPRANVAL
jgi:hypothetical protein